MTWHNLRYRPSWLTQNSYTIKCSKIGVHLNIYIIIRFFSFQNELNPFLPVVNLFTPFNFYFTPCTENFKFIAVADYLFPGRGPPNPPIKPWRMMNTWSANAIKKRLRNEMGNSHFYKPSVVNVRRIPLEVFPRWIPLLLLISNSNLN